jgi:hypothetical protein
MVRATDERFAHYLWLKDTGQMIEPSGGCSSIARTPDLAERTTNNLFKLFRGAANATACLGYLILCDLLCIKASGAAAYD